MDKFVDMLATLSLDIPPALVGIVAALLVSYAVYEFVFKKKMLASSAEKKLSSMMGDAQDDEEYEEIDVESWAYKLQVAGFTSIKASQAQTYMYAAAGIAAVVALIVSSFLGLPLMMMLALAVGAAILPSQFVNSRVKAQGRKINKDLPLVLKRMATAIAIQPDIGEAMAQVAGTLDPDAPLRAELLNTARDIRQRGQIALRDFERRAQHTSAGLAAFAFQLQRYAERGSGAFAEAFSSAADNMHRILEGRNKAEAKASEAMSAIKLIPAMLAVVLVYFMQDPAMKGAFTTSMMQLLLGGLVVWMLLGYWFMKGMIEEIG